MLFFSGTRCVTSLSGDFVQEGRSKIKIGASGSPVDVSTSGSLSGTVEVASGSKFCYSCYTVGDPVCLPSGSCACSP